VTHWRWKVLEEDARGRPKWRELRWSMTEESAAEWAKVNGKTLEKVPDSAEERQPVSMGTILGKLNTR
jgi:hypothetical protein